jgi:tetratricopeptide (TPR) repeat protein
MAKLGRNDPCPCGSGKKYKRCCLEKDEAAEREKALAAVASRPTIDVEVANSFAEFEPDDSVDELAVFSNAAVDLIHEGKLDEAEQLARDLLEAFPGMHDGWQRLGMVYEARGEHQKAADCYREVIELIRANPEDYDAGFEDIFHRLVAKLDPSTPTAA